MSFNKTIEKIDFLLSVFNEADKSHHQHESCCPTEHKNVCCETSKDVKYFQSPSEVKNGMNVRITSDAKLLGKLWDASGLGPMEELESFCDVVGTVQEVEESDNTVELRWENYDTAWIPLKACSDAGDAKPSLPGVQTSWLSPDKEENKDENAENNQEAEEQQPEDPEDESQIKYFVSVEDVKVGENARITKNYDLLEKCWQEAELEANDSKYNYLGIEGVIEKIDEDYDTVEIRWTMSESARIPVQACYRIGKKIRLLKNQKKYHT